MIPLQRKNNWPANWAEFIGESLHEKVSLDWGYLNCVSWTCRGIEAMTGTDLYTEFTGTSENAPDAARSLLRHGFTDLEKLAAHYLPEISMSEVIRGDVALITTGEEGILAFAMGLCDPPYIWALGREGEGLGRTFMLENYSYFKVGDL